MAESATSQQRRPLRLLSLDGGGIRGISELIILQEIMHRLKKRTSSNVDLLPADYFDMIGGTSTGGLIAILLGRLRLSVLDAIEKYRTLSKKVFSEKKKFGNILKDGAFKASNLEDAIKSVLEEELGKGHKEEKMFVGGGGGCKTFVCAKLAKHLNNDPTLFRTWEATKHPGHNCTIWEACRATSAAPRFFKRIYIGQPGLQEEYIDGGMGCNNPVKLLIKEALLEFEPDVEISCILSIGTGAPKVSSVDAPSHYQRVFPSELIDALKEFTTSSESVAIDVDRKYRNLPGLLHRLNVDKGLERVSLDEWERLGEVKSHTEKYLERDEIDRKIETIVAALSGMPEKKYPLAQLDNSVPYTLAIRTRKQGFHSFPPYLVNHFVGRKGVLDDMKKHFESCSGSSATPVFVLQGLGGCGKSQLALKYCQKTRDENPEGHVLWIDATSATTAQQSIATMVQIMSPDAGINTADHEANLRHFKQTIHTSGGSEQKWLLVFDNYDDPKNFNTKTLRDFFPQATHGSIIITTRITGVRRLGRYRDVSTMIETEALKLLMQSSETEECNTSIEEGTKIVKRLAFHALAIDQAGAYIRSRRLELGSYLDHYAKRREKVLREVPEEWAYFGRITDHPEAEIELSVFTTWELSFDQISGNDAARTDKKHILNLSGFLDNTEIKGDYFQAHASKNTTWLPTCRIDNDWDMHEFEDILKELRNLSLLESFEANLTKISYSLHPLIQDWIKLRLSPELRKEYATEASLMLSSYIWRNRGPGGQFLSLNLQEKQVLLAHIKVVLSNRQELRIERSVLEDENDLKAMHRFGDFLFVQGDYEHAGKLCRHILDIEKRTLGAEHPDTLISMANLASYLQTQAKYHEAELLYREVIRLTKKMEGERSDLLLLRRTNNYAGLLQNQNRYDEIERLIQSILPKAEKSLGKNHEEILRCKSFLAETLRGRGRYDEAEALNRELLQVQKSVFGKEHSDTLATMNNLALMLDARDKDEEAEKLYQGCLFGKEKVHGQRHPYTLLTVYNLGSFYMKNDNFIDGEAFLRRAFEGLQIVLGSNHPDTLGSLLHLGVVHYKKGDFIAAEEVFRSLVPRYESVFGLNHWNTTNCIGWLVDTLLAIGNKQEAQELQRDNEQRVRKRKEEEETKAKAAGPEEFETEELVAEDSEQETASDPRSTIDS